MLEPLACHHYRCIVVADFEFEFGGHDGNRPRPVCMVARDLLSGHTWRLWRDEFESTPPFPTGPETLFVAFMASAELGCFRALGWPTPVRILDLWVEFKNLTNGLYLEHGKGLLGALQYFRLDTITAIEKEEMRDLILAGGPWMAEQRIAILDYCESDIVGLEKLLPVMLPHIDLPRALLRGRYMAASAAMEFNGVPIDVETLERLRDHWTDIQDALIAAIDADYGVFEGRTFKVSKFEAFLVHHDIPWARLESGALDLDRNTFREMAKAYPIISPLHELRHALSELRLNALTVGEDGRNRTVLWAFASKTGRNQPSNSKYIFGPSVWTRGLIKPGPGCGVAYVDWATQEFGIAAALSGDEKMMAAYLSGDPYTAFGIQSKRLPPEATKETHPGERQLLKTCVLGVQYGMEHRSLARRMGQPRVVAREMLWQHRDTYRKFWQFTDAAVDVGLLGMPLSTVFGWKMFAGAEPNPRSLRNFPMQANGAEMLRLACCLGIERGVEIVAPVHDAVMIHAPLDRLDQDIATTRAAMAEASQIVLGGFEIRTDVHVTRYPDRYMDERGVVMWQRVTQLLAQAEEERATPPLRIRHPNINTLVYWIGEREQIRIRKERGAAAPWTDDEILRNGRFCNVRREDDRVTRWIAEHWRTPHADDPDLFFAMIVARLVNKSETLAQLGYPVPWDPARFRDVMAALDTPYGAAYMITAGRGYPDKPAFQVAEIFNPLWEARAAVRPRPGDTLSEFSTRLAGFKHLGSFYRGQIVADLKYVEPLRSASDWATFVLSGPGSRRGLNLVLGRSADASWTEREWHREFSKLRKEIAPDLERLGLGDLHHQDSQNCLCEISKYLLASSGERAVRRRYRSAGAA